MKDLGYIRKNDQMYPSMENQKENKKEYNKICLPLTVLGDKKVAIGDDIVVMVKGSIKGLHGKENWRPTGEIEIEAREGDVEEAKESKKETLLSEE